jgi:hypothetical protein
MERVRLGSAREFVPLDEIEPPTPADSGGPPRIILIADPIDTWESRTSLFGDPER